MMKNQHRVPHVGDIWFFDARSESRCRFVRVLAVDSVHVSIERAAPTTAGKWIRPTHATTRRAPLRLFDNRVGCYGSYVFICRPRARSAKR